MSRDTPRDRAQAFTLEGFIGAVIVLTAVLLASQAVVITPTTGGSVDRTTQAGLQQETNDALKVADSEGELSRMARYWDDDNNRFFNRSIEAGGNYTTDGFANESTFGQTLEDRFDEAGRSYNVELHADGSSTNLVFQGQPSSGAVSASHTIMIRGSDSLTAPRSADKTVSEASDSYPFSIGEDEVKVIEVRVVVW